MKHITPAQPYGFRKAALAQAVSLAVIGMTFVPVAQATVGFCTASNYTINNGDTVNSLCQIANNKSLIVNNGGSLQAGADTSTVNGSASAGSVTVNSGGSLTNISGAALTLNGSSTTSLSGSISNAGTISGLGHGIYSAVQGTGVAGGISNSGLIAGGTLSGSGIYVDFGSTIAGGVTNSGTIRGNAAGIYLAPGSSVPTEISLGGPSYGFGTATAGGTLLGGITNSGTISGSSTGIYVGSGATLSGGITNSGLIVGSSNSLNLQNGTASAFTVTNSGGTISGGAFNLGVNTLSLTGGLISSTINGGARIDISGSTSVTGSTAVFSSRITGSVSGASQINVNGAFQSENSFTGGTFNVNNGGTLYLQNRVSLEGGFNLNNGGILAITNNNPSISTNLFTNNSGGTGGTGNIVGLSIGAGQTLTINGSYTQTGTGILQTQFLGSGSLIEGSFAPTSTFGKLQVNGLVAMPSGSQIDVRVASGATITAGTRLFGVVTGASISPTATYTVTDNSSAFDFETFYSEGSLGLLVKQGSGLTAGTRPLMTTGIQTSVFEILRAGNRVIQARNEQNQGLSSGNDFLGNKQVWFKALGVKTRQDDSGNVSGYKADSSGLMIGVDGAVDANLRAGAAVSYTTSNLSSNRTLANHDATADSYRVIGYGSYNLGDRMEVNFQGDLSTGTIKGSRYIGVGDTASSKYDNFTWHVGAGVGKIFDLTPGVTTFTPSVRGDYTKTKDKAYTETGSTSGSNLTVQSNTLDEMIVAIDGKINHAITPSTNLSVNLGYGYDTIGKRGSLTAATLGGAPFVAQGMDPQRELATFGLGLTSQVGQGAELSARYDLEKRSGFTSQTASIKYRMAF